MTSVEDDLARRGEERDDLLARAREAIHEAQQASGAHDAAEFEDRGAQAATAISAANAIHLAPALAGLDNGVAPGLARPFIDETVRKLRATALALSKQRRAVDIPVFEPIDALFY